MDCWLIVYEHGMKYLWNEHGIVLVLPQAIVVGFGVDPMMLDLDIGLCSMISYFNLLET